MHLLWKFGLFQGHFEQFSTSYEFMVNFWPIFKDLLNSLYKFYAFMNNLWQVCAFVDKTRPISRTLQWYKVFFFFLRGEIRYTPSERREEREREIQPCGKRRKIWVQARPNYIQCKRHIDIYPLRQKGKSTGHARHTVGRKAQSYDGRPRPSQWGRQRPPPSGQRPSPARAPTRTSRRAGIGQGDLPHTKVTTSSLGCKEIAKSNTALTA